MNDEILDTADWSLIPPHMHEGLHRYIDEGIEPGGFMTAVLANDLSRAALCADSANKYKLADYIIFVHNYLPIGSYGSYEKVVLWMRMKKSSSLKKILPSPTLNCGTTTSKLHTRTEKTSYANGDGDDGL